MKKFYLQLSALILVAALLAGCSTVPITGRKQLSLVSADQEMQLGLTSFNEMKQEVPISKDPGANALLQKVGKKIATIAGPDMPNAQWEFVVFESKKGNSKEIDSFLLTAIYYTWFRKTHRSWTIYDN